MRPTTSRHIEVPLKVLYFGTPVVLISSLNPDGSTNVAPMSSAWWLGQDAMLGMANGSQTAHNLRRHGECVLNLAQSTLAASVNRLALLTGSASMPSHKAEMGYRLERDKFGAAGLTPQTSLAVQPDRVRECDIQLEGRVIAMHDFHDAGVTATAFQVRVERVHIATHLVVPGTSYVDPQRWDPLIMKFCEFFGNAENVSESRLARAWHIPRTRVMEPTRAAG
jgi:flavin reductase (DIM6/NTAB) family NADH-FMN oxidoreductase RutF